MSEYKKWERPPKIKTEGVITTCIAVPSRYIDAEWLKQNFNTVFWSQITKTIDSAPSIDIVHCIECRYKGMEICPMYKLTKAGVLKPYDFCSYGEKENNEGHN